jgi:hypothetical protein
MRKTSLQRVLLAALLVMLSAGQADSTSDRPNVWTSHGPEGAGVTALAIDPARPTTLYAGTWDDGVFRSANGGRNWHAFNAGLTSAYVMDLAIDPVTPTILYAGTQNGGVFAIQRVERIYYLPLIRRGR